MSSTLNFSNAAREHMLTQGTYKKQAEASRHVLHVTTEHIEKLPLANVSPPEMANTPT